MNLEELKKKEICETIDAGERDYFYFESPDEKIEN